MKKANKYINIRLLLVCAALSLAIISVVTKLVLLSISDGVFLQNEGKKRYIKYREIKSVRGGIYDRNNFPLAISIVNYDLYALSGLTKNELKKVNVVLDNELNFDKNFLFKKKTLLKKNITPTEHIALKELNLNRLEVEVRHSRHYPLGDQIAPLVGFYGKDGAQEGLEMSY
ncbi:MAG: cell division protein FtsI, partial [SAR86 cluster bacterium]|nr:cell division protein FtsI [SAR86 cluster bacterium]